ncbi:MAG: hypothetical protein C0399_09440 [Syntrophus sp. (in: bacteria)]|nr:hypothetical protein [Syntrophus sp. (in: bacteria)]
MTSNRSDWITFKAIDMHQLTEELVSLIDDIFGFPKDDCRNLIDNYLKHLRDDLAVLIEYPYVDNVFRDSYYFYFSSKHRTYERNCIRLSFFDGLMNLDSFRDGKLSETIKDKFLGICVIRPTYPQFFGKTMLSPKALKNQSFVSCLGRKTFSVNGFKLPVFSFPHSSQDGEYITCAETSVWSVMEYFGNKYAEYNPVLPSQIVATLSGPASERMVPSRGLTINQISFTFKDFGFGARVYAKEAYKNNEDDFKRILSFYIESGIPVIVGLQNEHIGHAVVLIGHEIPIKDDLGDQNVSFELENTRVGIIDTADFQKDYVVIDDNFPPYQSCSFAQPACYYDDIKFKTLQIVSFVVPLYPKIYLEAFEGHKLAIEILDKLIKPNVTDPIVLRFFLTSSRSLKTRIAADANADDILKELIISKTMPKFIWVAELSDSRLYAGDKANGLILLDATGRGSIEDVLFAVFQGKIYISKDNQYTIYDVGIKPFGIFRNNLKGEWSEWKE